jgi:hypothetical protein
MKMSANWEVVGTWTSPIVTVLIDKMEIDLFDFKSSD